MRGRISVRFQPNILIIVCDQLSWKAISANGNTCAKTPHIDCIARQGVSFSNCYTPYPLCIPARASFWTGRFPHETRVQSNKLRGSNPFCRESIPEGMPTLGTILSEAGYETVHFGKRHAAGATRGFLCFPEKQTIVKGAKAWPLNQDTFKDRYTVEKAIEYIARDKVNPFLAIVSLNNPHNICGWIGANKGLHTNQPIKGKLPPLPKNFAVSEPDERPLPIRSLCDRNERLSQASHWNPMDYQHYLAAYYHYCRRVDAEVGKVLDALSTSPTADDTLIVFFSDHGEGMGAHGMVTKGVTFYEEVMRVPMLFAGLGINENEVLEKPLTSLLDLLPTLCDYAGIRVPRGIWGRSLLPWLQGKEGKHSPHEYVASEWFTLHGKTVCPGRMIRTVRYKYIKYAVGNGEEMYDLRNDPGEMENLVTDSRHHPILEDHQKILKSHLQKTKDPFESLS